MLILLVQPSDLHSSIRLQAPVAFPPSLAAPLDTPPGRCDPTRARTQSNAAHLKQTRVDRETRFAQLDQSGCDLGQSGGEMGEAGEVQAQVTLWEQQQEQLRVC